MKDIMLDQLLYYPNLEFTVLYVEQGKENAEEMIKKRFNLHGIQPSLKPQSLKGLDDLEFKWLQKSEYYERVSERFGPYLRCGSFELLATRYCYKYNGKEILAWDLGCQLVYNKEPKKRKLFKDLESYNDFISQFENTFEKATDGYIDIPQAKFLAAAFNEMLLKNGKTTSRNETVAHILIEKQNKYRGTDEEPLHYAFNICTAWVEYLKTVGDPKYATSFFNFISGENYLGFKGDQPPENIIKMYDPAIIDLMQ